MEQLVDINIDLDYFNKQIKDIENKPSVRYRGKDNSNIFATLEDDNKKYLASYLNNLLDINYKWSFSYCYTREPVGIHNDYETRQRNMGIIIPLSWECKQPYTFSFDKETLDGKVVFKQGEMRYLETNNIIDYRTDYLDEFVKKVIPKNRQSMYNGLKVYNTYKWKLHTLFIFEAMRWHSSSWFLEDNKAGQYKAFINGFGGEK